MSLYYINLLLLFILFLLKPVAVLAVGIIALNGFLISCKREITQILVYGVSFFYIKILGGYFFGAKLSSILIYIAIETSILILYFIYRKSYRDHKYIIQETFPTYVLTYILFFAVILSFFSTYYNFSDAAFHYSLINKTILEDRLINHDPFYGSDFYDPRYSYSFIGPLSALLSRLVMVTGLERIDSINIVWDSFHIILFFLANLVLYEVVTIYSGKKTAFNTLFIFFILFVLVRASGYRGYGFSLANYPSAWMVWLFFPVYFLFYKTSTKIDIIFLSFITGGIHLFYNIFFFPVILLGILTKNKKRRNDYIIKSALYTGVTSIFVYVKYFYHSFKTENTFFISSLNIDRWFNFSNAQILIPGFLPVLSIIILFYFRNLFKRKRIFFIWFGIVTVFAFFAPEISGFLNYNTQKFNRIYQLFPVLFVIPALFTLLWRKYRKYYVYVMLFILIAGTVKTYFFMPESGVEHIKPLAKIFSKIPEKSLVLADEEVSMLISSVGLSDVVYVYREYSSPAVSEIELRQGAFYRLLTTGDNYFKADFAVIPPSKREFINNNIDFKDIGGGFCLIELKK
ncbi:MAG: hypothetical protein WC002_10320 [Candidatus Muiribacteriota bacterium]